MSDEKTNVSVIDDGNSNELKYQTEIEKYEELKKTRETEIEKLGEEYTYKKILTQFTKLQLKQLIFLLNSKYQWTESNQAIFLVNLNNDVMPVIKELKNDNDFVTLTNLNLETLRFLLQKFQGTGLADAKKVADGFSKISLALKESEHYQQDVKKLQRAVKAIEFKISSYQQNIKPADEDPDLEKIIDNGIEKLKEEK